jgi:hypothetical protein
MILKEFFYFNSQDSEMADDPRYDNNKDTEVKSRSDTRKTKLTLRQINRLRKASEQHYLEQEKDADHANKMYSNTAMQPQ